MSDHPLDDATPPIPEDIEALAEARAGARLERDFTRADELKARIEAAGWKVIDGGSRYKLIPARPPDRVDDGRVVHGSAAAVPSRLGAPARPGATVVIVASDLERAIATATTARAVPHVDIVLVASDGRVERTGLLDGLRQGSTIGATEVGGPSLDPHPVEVLWTTHPFGPAAALVAGLRRVGREVVIVLEAGSEVDGAIVAPIVSALGDASVAAVGIDGLASTDLHRFTTVGPDGPPVVALGPALVAFRRTDVSRLDALDGRLESWAGVIAWSSLALREGGDGEAARRVVVVDLRVRARPAPSDVARRDRYRISARFGEDDALRA